MDGLETILSVWDFAYFQVYMFVYYMSVIQNLKLVQMILSFFGGKLDLYCFRGAVLVRFREGLHYEPQVKDVFVVRNSEFVLKRYPLGIRELEPLKNPLEAVGLSHCCA